MASTKTATALFNTTTLTADAGDTTSSVVSLVDGYGAAAFLKLENGATGPTIAAQIQIELSGDNTEWYKFGGALVGSTANDAITSWAAIEIPIAAKYLRLVAGSNTDQDVTADADVVELEKV